MESIHFNQNNFDHLTEGCSTHLLITIERAMVVKKAMLQATQAGQWKNEIK